MAIAGHIWTPFLLSSLFDFSKGNQNNMASTEEGLIPLVSAKKCDNGIKAFIRNNGKKLYAGHCITLNNDGDGGAGLAFYQPTRMALDSHCTALIPKTDMSRYTMLFIAMCISKQRILFGHGRAINASRLRIFRLMLPTDDAGNPDYAYMDSFMRDKEQKMIKQTIDILCKRLIISNITGGGGNLLHVNWKEFYFTDVFEEIQRGKRLKKEDHSNGAMPYVSSTALNNGIDGFIGNSEGVRIYGNCLSIANSGSVGNAFFHQYDFVASDHVTHLKREGIDKYAYLFMVPIINRLAEKYSFNREINDERIRRERLMLPATENGEIDFAFMSSFMKDIEKDILKTTLKHFKTRSNQAITGGGKMEVLFRP